MRIMLVGSSGGHLLQLFALRDWWSSHERMWVTFEKPDAISLLSEECVVWGHHPTTRNLPNLLRNLILAREVISDWEPDLIVSTGAGIAVPFFLAARVRRIPTIFIEVFDRIDSATVTGRLVEPIADAIFVQWKEQLHLYRRAELAGPLLLDPWLVSVLKLDSGCVAHEDVFVTVGTDHHPFDRLMQWIDQLATQHPERSFFVQRGTSTPPRHVRSIESMPVQEFWDRLARASVVISHAGPGTVALALAAGKKPIVVARMKEFGEHVDNHQVRFARHLSTLGVADVSRSPGDLRCQFRAFCAGDNDDSGDVPQMMYQGLATRAIASRARVLVSES